MRPGRPGSATSRLVLTLTLVASVVAACARPTTPTTPTVPPNGTAPAPTSVATGTPVTAPGAPSATTAAPTASAVPPTATPATQQLADTVNRYLQAWQAGKYADMYALLSANAQASISQDKFVARYTNIASGIGQTGVTVAPQVPSNPAPTGTPPTINVPFHVTYKLNVLGNVDEDNVLPLVVDNGTWKVAWTPGLIFKDLTADRIVRYDPVLPTRGSILDRNGNILADQGKILTVGVVPGEIKDEKALLTALSDYLKLPQDQIKKDYAGAQPDWFVPIKDLPLTDKAAAQQKLGKVLGVSLQERERRVYPYGAATSDFVGYVTRATADDVKRHPDRGWDVGDWIGRAGIEAWGDKVLAGQKGATLAILEADGTTVVRTIAQKEAVPGANILTTVDVNTQIQANKILGDHAGSLVVMDPRDNSIEAISSNPSFDPNLFVLGMSDAQWAQLNGPTRPLLYRPAEGLYPTGSIFKVITLAAGLEKAGFKPADKFDCGLDWHGPGGIILHNWRAEGTLDLIQSLTGSCDPTFYTIGLKLNQIDPNILPTFARAFGLGQPTGTSGLDDAAGLVPDPQWKQKTLGQPWYDGDGINLAIGQGYLLATPLQMANVYSTLANHGRLRNPVLVNAIKRPDGTVVQSFQAQVKGNLPVSPTNLGYIYQGMRGVTSTPLGTAYYAWKGSTIPMEAKTGSAENETKKAHAWFVGYTPPENSSLLVLVMLEGGELGGEYAAPLGRQIVEYALQHPVKPLGG